jgi:hypothetical protein
MVQIINVRVDGGLTKTININHNKQLQAEDKRRLQKNSGKAGRAVQNVHTQWRRGCCTEQSNTTEHGILYKIFTHNGVGYAVQNIHI